MPAALGVVDMSATFSKGCYIGQELVARMDSRGNNSPRRLMSHLRGSGRPPQVGEEAFTETEPVAGCSPASSPFSDGWLAFASVKRAALEGGELSPSGQQPALMSRPQAQASAGTKAGQRSISARTAAVDRRCVTNDSPTRTAS